MEKNNKKWVSIVVVISFLLCVFGSDTKVVNAAYTCTWNGATDINWFVSANWSDCNNSVPTTADDVIIPGGVVRFPTINWRIDPLESSAWANDILIEHDAQLTIVDGSNLSGHSLINEGTFIVQAEDAPVSFGTFAASGTFTNNGTLNVNGNNSSSYFEIYPAFINSGTVNLSGASLGLSRGGTHSGYFSSDTNSYLYLGNPGVVNQTFTFDADSEIRVNRLFVREGTANINGTYWPPAVGSILIVQAHTQSASIRFGSSANVVNMPETVNVDILSKIYFEVRSLPYFLSNVNLRTGGEINNLGEVTISNLFRWSGGKISGGGTTTLNDGVTGTIESSAYSTNIHELDEQLFVNAGTINWTGVDINILNGAVFQNDGVFNANATTRMTGGINEEFQNNGSFIKKTINTTTTMDIEFSNTGEIEVQAGTLDFLKGLTTGSGTSVDLGGGTLTSGETLTLTTGASLVGTGTLDGDLENGGEVSPGMSPGVISVTGDYRQTSEGVLTVELAGVTAGTQYDQLLVLGNATLAGDLMVTLLDLFSPQAGDQFTLMSYASRSGQFEDVMLPALAAGLTWEVETSETALILTVLGPEETFMFLPMLLR